MCQKPLRTSELYAPVKKDSVTKDLLSTELSHSLCAKVVTLLPTTELVANPSTEKNLPTRTLSTSTSNQTCFPWQTAVPTPMVLNSLSPPYHAHGLTANTACLANL